MERKGRRRFSNAGTETKWQTDENEMANVAYTVSYAMQIARQ